MISGVCSLFGEGCISMDIATAVLEGVVFITITSGGEKRCYLFLLHAHR